ncbi:unnamed protein product [Calicophoron daubneyi]|uniref:Cadherin domain-containing protein n=1 Tax=Calicophoron daubneyi TaxID=300641 RepID=A0AAV2T5B1_CALDB
MILILWFYLFIQHVLVTECTFYTQTRQILPADSYQILGQPGLRRLGRCNLTYAWLVPPPSSSLDAYGHALACTRLQLQSGRVIRSALTPPEELEGKDFGNHPDQEMERIDKELVASLVDLNRLDALMRAEQTSTSQGIALPGGQLADGNRYFYLADRIGNLNIMVLLRPGQQIKLEVIDPISSDHLVTPEHVLCSRKECPPTPTESPEKSVAIEPVASTNYNRSRSLIHELHKAERQNRELYMQLIISRVACALLSFLCIVLAVTSLALCLRLRRFPSYCRKRAPPSELSVYREPNLSPSFYQPNGKLGNVGQASPAFITDTSPTHMGFTHVPSETASVNNVVMTASNLSDYGGVPGMQCPISYAALGAPYSQLSAYQVPAGRGSLYNETSGVVTLVPLNSRGVILPYQNGSASPVPSNHSQPENKMGVARSGSLGRHSITNGQFGDIARRKMLRQTRAFQGQQTESGSDKNGTVTPVIVTTQDGLQSLRATDLVLKTTDTQIPKDLLTFQTQPSNLASVVHRYPGEIHTIYGKVVSPHGSVTDERGSVKSNQINNINEPCVGLIRKPALAE